MLGVGVLLSAPVQALACAACFGKSDSDMAKGMNAGIMALLVFVLGFWVLFGSFFVYIARRGRQNQSELPGEKNDPQHN